MQPLYIASTRVALAILALIFAVEAYQSGTTPMRASEAYVYDRFVRPSFRQVLAEELPNREVLYALLEKRSIGLFHVSPFSVRLPALLFGLLYFWSVWRLARLWLGGGRSFLILTIAASLVPLEWDCFSKASGFGVALGLASYAVALAAEYLQRAQLVNPINLNLIGACLGLSVAARLAFFLPALGIALVLLAFLVKRQQGSSWVNRVLIPFAVIGFVFLILPLSHAHGREETPPELADTPEGALSALRSRVGNRPISIATNVAAQPIVNFYRAHYRLNEWSLASSDLTQNTSDFYLFPAADAQAAMARHLVVVYRDSGFVLVRRADAP